MELRTAIETLHSDSAFSGWKEKHKDSFFSHAFCMHEDNAREWQLGFYQKKNGKITTFIVRPDAVELRPKEEVFKREETEVMEISLPDGALPVREILSRAQQFQAQNYPRDRGMKTITLLQHLQPYGCVWNLTFVTQAFNTLNMKVSPESGEVLEHKLSSIFSFRQA